ncbi:MAG: hypothetical protein QM621_13400, partial [Aeromicrobium sp.]|uniref:Ig-like domain-containing protein n=1 Tax=Aeromicrobium sp. TaxID=1871063 RepID=UPI0039E3B94D
VDGGTWSVTGGKLVFTPNGDIGDVTPPPVDYVVNDGDGTPVSGTVTTTVAGSGEDDAVVVVPGQPVTVDVLDNDDLDGADPDSLRLVDPATGGFVTTLTVDGGTWSVTGGKLVFTPNGDIGNVTPPPVRYVVNDGDGNPFFATVTTKVATSGVGDTATGQPGGPLRVDPLANDGNPNLDPDTLRLVDPVTGQPVTRVEFPEGVWEVDSETGELVFTPAPGFVGQAPPVAYIVQDPVTGEWLTAEVTGVVEAAPVVSTPEPTPTPTPAPSEQTKDSLPGTGSRIAPAVLLVTLVMLALGVGVLRHGRRIS